MRLSHLTLTSFRSYVDTTIDLTAPRVLIAGLNGSGKTGIKNAIRWVLTGRCAGTDGRGAGAEVLIPVGAKVAEVSCVLGGIGNVSRAYTEKGGGTFAVEGFTGTAQAQQQGLLMKLNTLPAFLDAVLDTETFLRLEHAEAKALVLALLDVKIPVGDKSYTLDALDMHYKQAFEDRKAAKKVLQGIVVPPPVVGAMPTLEQIEAQLTKLRTALGELQQAVGTVSGRRVALQQERARVEPQALAVLDDDQAALLADLQAQLADFEAEAVPVVDPPPAQGDPKRVTFVRSTVTTLQGHVPAKGCVIDPSVPCKTPGKAFSDRLHTLTAELKRLDPRPIAVASVATASPLTALRTQIADLDRRQAKRRQTLEAMHVAAQRVAAIDQELAVLPSTEAQDREIATIRSRIQKGDTLLAEARTFWAAQAHRERILAAHQQAQAEVDRLEALVETLGPKGARVPALAAAMARFDAAVNPSLAPFGWTIGFIVDPWGVTANGRPVDTYSRSERYRIGIALQMAIAQLSGLNFAVVDEVDMLDVANRGIVSSMLQRAPLEQILILGTRESSQALPQVAGVVALRLALQDGRTIVAERSAA